jgi:hypothetical protein
MDKAGNPKNFYTSISTVGGTVISGQFLAEIKAKMQKKYSGKGDLIDI